MNRQERPSTARSHISDEQDDAPPLSAEACDLLETALSDRRLLAGIAPELPDAARLVRYLSGALAPDAAADLERCLLIEPELRSELRRARTALTRLQAQPLFLPLEPFQAQHEEFYAGVASAWQELVAERIAATPQSRERWQMRGWERIRHEVAAGVRPAQAAWATFLAFAEQWRAALALHALTPALQRGSQNETGASQEVLNAGIAITDVECHVDSDGTLNIVAKVAPVHQGASPGETESTLLLSLRRDDDLWPLARGVRIKDRVEWRLPGFGAALGLPSGPLPPQFFAFDVAEAASAPPQGVRSMLARVFDAAGQLVSGALAYIELIGAPRWENGQFVAEVAIPAFIRLAYPSHHLELSLYISEQSRQRLGLWAISDWDDAPRLLAAASPGIPDTILLNASIMQARLVDP